MIMEWDGIVELGDDDHRQPIWSQQLKANCCGVYNMCTEEIMMNYEMMNIS
jgi:hypothetical protein